jgi:hypothetical protein
VRAIVFRTVCCCFVVVLVSCGRGFTRDGLRDRYVDEIVDAGIPRDVAECVIDRLFGELSDDELREFNTAGESLTAEQSQRVADLAEVCASAP